MLDRRELLGRGLAAGALAAVPAAVVTAASAVKEKTPAVDPRIKGWADEIVAFQDALGQRGYLGASSESLPFAATPVNMYVRGYANNVPAPKLAGLFDLYLAHAMDYTAHRGLFDGLVSELWERWRPKQEWPMLKSAGIELDSGLVIPGDIISTPNTDKPSMMFGGKRMMFDRKVTPRFTKDVDELLTDTAQGMYLGTIFGAVHGLAGEIGRGFERALPFAIEHGLKKVIFRYCPPGFYALRQAYILEAFHYIVAGGIVV